jgi:hypothetical protein
MALRPVLPCRHRTTIVAPRILTGHRGATARSFSNTHRLVHPKITEHLARGLAHSHPLVPLGPFPGREVAQVLGDTAPLVAAVAQAATKESTTKPLRAGRSPCCREMAENLPIGQWEYCGTGHQSEGDAWLAEAHHGTRQCNWQTAWEER